MYEERIYRSWVKSADLVSFEVKEEESDLFISVDSNLQGRVPGKSSTFNWIISHAREILHECRESITQYIEYDRVFGEIHQPYQVREDAPPIVREMAEAAAKAGVGPMAAVAGAVAEYVGRELVKFSEQIIVENGGDIFLKTNRVRSIGIYAGASSFSGQLFIELEPEPQPVAICTSSGTVGHSFSYGRTDAAVVLSTSTILADAVATAAGNCVKEAGDIERVLDWIKSIEGVRGLVVILGEYCGAWGDVKLRREKAV